MHNGYKNWAHWDVALWLYNDSSLYSIVEEARSNNRTISSTANAIIEVLRELNITCTPDGAKFSRAAVMAALRAWM